MSYSFDCENYGDDCGGHRPGIGDYTPDLEWQRREEEFANYLESFLVSVGSGAYFGAFTSAILWDKYEEIVGLGVGTGIGIGSIVGACVGGVVCGALYRVAELLDEKGYLKKDTDKKTDISEMNQLEIPIENFFTGDQELDKIIQADDKAVRRLGVTHEQIANRIEYFAKEARSRSRRYLYGGSVDERFDDVYEIKTHPFAHQQKCSLNTDPSCKQKYGDRNVRVRNLKLGEELFFPSLITHSIREHRYYGGQKLHRVDPKRAVRILDIKPRCAARKDTGKAKKDARRIVTTTVGTTAIERRVDEPSLKKEIMIGRSFEGKPLYRLKWPRLEEARQRRRHELIKQILADPETRRWGQTVGEVFYIYGIDL